MIFRLSQRLNKKINGRALSTAPLDENPYADWSARLFTVNRTQYILLSHTTSLYSVVMYGRGITHDGLLIDRALDNIRKFMDDDGLMLIYMNFIAPATDSFQFSKALNRSVTGSMNELVFQAGWFLQNRQWSPFDVGFQLNETPLSALCTGKRYAVPRDAFKRIAI